MAAYLKAPTILYHPTLARDGRIFQGDAERPIPHPGEGWVDSPADLPTEGPEIDADAVVAANAAAKTATDKVASLEAQVKDGIARAEAAEEEIGKIRVALNAERNDHAGTKARLEAASGTIIGLQERLKEMESLPTEVSTLKEALAKAQADVARLSAQLAKFDGDGDGKVGGSRPK